MGLFGNENDEWNSIKDEYREVKQKIAEWNADSYPAIGYENSLWAPKFEYLTLENINDSEIDERGRQGWELVNFASYFVGWGAAGNTSMKVHFRYVFKRPEAAKTALKDDRDTIVALQSRKAELVAEIERRGFKAE